VLIIVLKCKFCDVKLKQIAIWRSMLSEIRRW